MVVTCKGYSLTLSILLIDMTHSVVLFAVALACWSFHSFTVNGSSDPVFDHQTETYKATFEPVSCEDDDATGMPFFSPDHSIDAYVQLIQSAMSSIDLYTPGFSSWSYCTSFDASCIGCTLEGERNESFPVFAALLNAVHERGVHVRILTNDYDTPTCKGKVTPLDWLCLNGIEVRTFTTVTFMHAKVMVIDKGKKTSISSVNFSYTSFMENREAGVVISGPCQDFVTFMSSVFELDWNMASNYTLTNKYNSSDMDYITNTDHFPVDMPTPHHIDNAYVTTLTNVSNVQVTTLYTSPDYALAQLNRTMQAVTKSFQLMIYQITDPELCDAILKMQSNGIDVQLLVSSRIFSYNDWKSAQDCYQKLYDNKVPIQKTPSYYTYSHQKFWIIDGEEVHLSTGNWSPTDYPVGLVFPPYRSSDWQDTNRNFIVGLKNSDIVSIFAKVIEEDGKNGTPWQLSLIHI